MRDLKYFESAKPAASTYESYPCFAGTVEGELTLWDSNGVQWLDNTRLQHNLVIGVEIKTKYMIAEIDDDKILTQNRGSDILLFDSIDDLCEWYPDFLGRENEIITVEYEE